VDCPEPNIPGKCMELGVKDGCCPSHLDCAPGLECRNSYNYKTCPPASTAVCLPKPENGVSCWHSQDCAESQVCRNARICSCGVDCPPVGWEIPLTETGASQFGLCETK
jgi:hypothetical protein